MKKLTFLSLCLIIALTLGVAACRGNNAPETEAQKKAKVDAAMNTVNLSVNVTDNLMLPTSSGDVAISWTSDKASVISNSGTVVRPSFGSSNEEVKLTGSFSYKDYSDTKVYTLSVKSIKEKVYTFANGHTGSEAVFTVPSDGSYGTIVDKGEGVITLKPSLTSGQAPYFKISEELSEWRGSGYTTEVLVYVDHEEMKEVGNSFIIDFSLNKSENAPLGSVYLSFDADENHALIYHSHSEDTNADTFETMSGWYNVGVRFFEKSGKLNAKAYINDIMGVELHAWEITKFRGFDAINETPEPTPATESRLGPKDEMLRSAPVTESRLAQNDESLQSRNARSGEVEATEEETGETVSAELMDITITNVAAPRYLSFRDVNLNGIDIKQVKLSYSD